MTGSLVIGVDVGGTNTKAGLVDLGEGRVVRQASVPTRTNNADQFIAGIVDLAAQLGADNDPAAAIGIGVPGFAADGVVDTTFGFLPFMEDFPLADRIETALRLPCRIDNDARFIALGEAHYGAAKGFSRALTFTLGTGLGVGWTIDGRLPEARPYAHMAGHMAIRPTGPECACGRPGCLESWVCATGLLALARQEGVHAVRAEDVFAKAAGGETSARRALDAYVEILAAGVDSFVQVYAPDVIVFGGGVAQGLGPWLPTLTGHLRARPFKRYHVRVSQSSLGVQAGILGAAASFTLSQNPG